MNSTAGCLSCRKCGALFPPKEIFRERCPECLHEYIDGLEEACIEWRKLAHLMAKTLDDTAEVAP